MRRATGGSSFFSALRAVAETSTVQAKIRLHLVETVGGLAAGADARLDAHLDDTARLLSLKPMVWIGGISYAIYLWHWPLITIAKQTWPEVRIRHLVLIGLLSIVLAWITKHLVEDPVRFHPGLSAKASRGLLFGGASMLVTALVGGAAGIGGAAAGADLAFTAQARAGSVPEAKEAAVPSALSNSVSPPPSAGAASQISRVTSLPTRG